MIKSNLMPSSQDNDVSKNSRSKKMNKKAAPKKSSGGLKVIGNLFYMLLFLVMAAIMFLEFQGVPEFLEGKIPIEVLSFLGIAEEPPVERAPREPGAPALTAQGYDSSIPNMPINGSVEEVVKTMRPDVFLADRIFTDYKEQALVARIPYQKEAFHIMLSTFYDATPDGVGYLDLAYQAPNFYFARGISVDGRTYNILSDHLKSRTMNLSLADSSTLPDGMLEFSVFGEVKQPEVKSDGQFQLTSPTKIREEISALRNLALKSQVNFSGMDKPTEERFDTYRRVLLRVSTDADYPSLLNFAQTLQKSNSKFGVQKFSSQPLGQEKMRSIIEFVMYAAVK